MEFAPTDLRAIPIHQLSSRRLHLGPFGSGRDLAKFLCIAVIGAVVAAVSSAVLWLPFLGLGAMVAFVRVEGRTLDDYALGYCRFRWRAVVMSSRSSSDSPSGRPSLRGEGRAPSSIRAGGIPIAYLPPVDLQRLFDEWRAILTAFDRPLGFGMRGERFSPLPFIPAFQSPDEGERAAIESYRELVRLLLRRRYRRVVDLTVWNDPFVRDSRTVALDADVAELLSALERLGVPAHPVSGDVRESWPSSGVVP
jgi:hypothetical protein